MWEIAAGMISRVILHMKDWLSNVARVKLQSLSGSLATDAPLIFTLKRVIAVHIPNATLQGGGALVMSSACEVYVPHSLPPEVG